jgi:argininosuccinate synthase
VYEAPAATVLYAAHAALEELAIDRDTLHYKESIGPKYAELAYYGLWFTPLRKALDAFIDETQKTVNGTVKLKLYKGTITIASRTSPDSLYWEKLATFGRDEVYNQKDAEGFINLFGLPIKVKAILDRERGRK